MVTNLPGKHKIVCSGNKNFTMAAIISRDQKKNQMIFHENIVHDYEK